MKDLGQLQLCLGINTDYTETSLKFHHRHYAQPILKKYKMSDCKPVETPLASKLKLVKDANGSKAISIYIKCWYSLLYASTATGSDIMHVVGVHVLSKLN